MNMKTLTILSVGLLGAASASAAGLSVSTSNTLCRIEVASGTENTIVAVPLKAIASSDSSIAITDYIATNNLASGDVVLYKDGSTWKSWKLSDAGAWEAVSVSQYSQTTDAADTGKTLTTGDALWLVRTTPSAGSFYLYGETNATVALPSFTRSSSSLVYTMMPNPNLAETKINDLSFSTTPAAGDKIVVPGSGNLEGMTYVYHNSKWCTTTQTSTTVGSFTYTSTGYTETTDSIPAGQGFWYIAAASN